MPKSKAIVTKQSFLSSTNPIPEEYKEQGLIEGVPVPFNSKEESMSYYGDQNGGILIIWDRYEGDESLKSRAYDSARQELEHKVSEGNFNGLFGIQSTSIVFRTKKVPDMNRYNKTCKVTLEGMAYHLKLSKPEKKKKGSKKRGE